MEKDHDEKLYTMAEATDLLGVCRHTIYEWIDNGHIKTVRVGKGWNRIQQSEIDRILTK